MKISFLTNCEGPIFLIWYESEFQNYPHLVSSNKSHFPNSTFTYKFDQPLKSKCQFSKKNSANKKLTKSRKKTFQTTHFLLDKFPLLSSK